MATQTPLVRGVDFICVPTRDYEKAAEFYSGVLGLELGKRWGQMPAGEFETGSLTIALLQSDAFGLEFAPHTHPIEFHVDDFEAAKAEGVKTIDISDFVPYEEIDPIYFEKTYFLGPQSGGEKVYSLLREAMEKTELAGIAKFVMRDRQHLGCLRVREGTLTLEKMFFHDEVRPIDEIKPRKTKVSKSELDMATSLIERFTSSFEPEKYTDTYREALCEIVKAKRKGTTITALEPETEEEPADLMAALRASVEAAKKRSSTGSRSTNRRPARRSTTKTRTKAAKKSPAKKPSATKKKTGSRR